MHIFVFTILYHFQDHVSTNLVKQLRQEAVQGQYYYYYYYN